MTTENRWEVSQLVEPELIGEELTGAVIDLCRSKAEEFQFLGYEHTTWEEVWNCVNHKYVNKPEPPLHQMVNDILTLRADGMMNYLTLAALKEAPFS
ncbi:post-transcriptional regulator [Saccharibacillus sp. JS10]|uniref:post-transcriptional regulator n=1 Tax=Saccharibacillus sp. JS10 TaxID=2950552 RepID=UPI00210D471D|nr:post-transcriptional regulator [Saccharibacillus sp. JS10]MCQ4086294.1 post-transcriptional regulator [Saccharibacillus sp. JS10]